MLLVEKLTLAFKASERLTLETRLFLFLLFIFFKQMTTKERLLVTNQAKDNKMALRCLDSSTVILVKTSTDYELEVLGSFKDESILLL